MYCVERDYISVSIAAKYAGVSEAAIYKAIKHKTLDAHVEIVGGLRRYKIQTNYFVTWIEQEIQRYKKRTGYLLHTQQKLKEFMYGT